MDYQTYSLQRVYTEANINEVTFRTVDECTDALCNIARNKLVDLTDDIELVVQLEVEQTSEVSCKYYFVDHKARTLFWLVDLNEETEGIFSAIQVYDLTHMGASCRTYDTADMNHH
jgi:type III secretory pathway component EscU